METKRKPRRSRIGGARDILTVEAPPGKVYRWVNDINDRVSRTIEDGWSVVAAKGTQVGDKSVINQNNAVGSGARKAVGTKPDGTPLMAVLMELDTEEHDLRQSEFNEEAAKPIKEIKKRKHGGDGNYGKVEVA